MEIGEAVSIGPNLDGVVIAAGTFGAMALGTFIFYVMQIIKGFAGERVSGKAAEAMVLLVSALSITVALVSADADWYDSGTYVALIVGTLGATVIARGVYAQLFKVSVVGSPPSSEAIAMVVADPQATTEIEAVPDATTLDERIYTTYGVDELSPRQEGIA